jgi:hypothetical protein
MQIVLSEPTTPTATAPSLAWWASRLLRIHDCAQTIGAMPTLLARLAWAKSPEMPSKWLVIASDFAHPTSAV